MKSLSFKIKCTAAALAAALPATAGPTELEAQRQGSAAAAGSAPVERAIRLADELDLTADQQTRLEAIRVAILEERTSQVAALMALRSEIAAGMREPEALREAFSAQWREGRESLREQLNEILTEDQREELQRMSRLGSVRQRGPAHRGRIDRQRGPRGGRSFDRCRWPLRCRVRGR